MIRPPGRYRRAYKLFRLRADGTIGPLFINRHQVIPLGEWLPAKPHPTKGYQFRPYWHVAPAPFAPHLSLKNRIWMRVEIVNYHRFPRPHIQGGAWLLANWLRVLGPVKSGVDNQRNLR